MRVLKMVKRAMGNLADQPLRMGRSMSSSSPTSLPQASPTSLPEASTSTPRQINMVVNYDIPDTRRRGKNTVIAKQTRLG